MKEKIFRWLAWRMPKGLVYWCSMRLGASVTQGEYGDTVVPELTFMDAVERWRVDYKEDS